ncbi:MAG: histidine kinase [Actinomycetaceae bacterium]|nr:histidine kinase [Actinomycetaceae bacterium]
MKETTENTKQPTARLIPLTVTHLAALAIIAIPTIVVLVVLIALTLVTTPLFGLGLLLFLPIFVSASALVARFEINRVSGLYGIDAPPLPPRPLAGPGMGAKIRALLSQAFSARRWRALSSLLTGALFGALILGSLNTSFSLFAWGINADSIPLSVLRIGGGILDILLIPLLGYLHQFIALNLVGGQSKKELADAAIASGRQRASAIEAANVERTRLERDLHDGVQPRLVSIGMTLDMAKSKIESDPSAAQDLVADAHQSTKAAITELRQLVRGIHASILMDRGLDAALSALAGRSHIPVELNVQLPYKGRAKDARTKEAEEVAYFVVAEALTNAAKHSHAARCQVTIWVTSTRAQDDMHILVTDDGVGGARSQPGGGISGITQRVQSAGGTMQLTSPDGGPTIVEVRIPCGS